MTSRRPLNISEQTIRNRLHEGGLNARHPFVGPVLSAKHNRARMAFAIDHQNWQMHPMLLAHLNLMCF